MSKEAHVPSNSGACPSAALRSAAPRCALLHRAAPHVYRPQRSMTVSHCRVAPAAVSCRQVQRGRRRRAWEREHAARHPILENPLTRQEGRQLAPERAVASGTAEHNEDDGNAATMCTAISAHRQLTRCRYLMDRSRLGHWMKGSCSTNSWLHLNSWAQRSSDRQRWRAWEDAAS
jgi:hypothetical protein